MSREVAELAADLAAVLADWRDRGVVDLPLGSVGDVRAVSTPAVSRRVDPGGAQGWGAIASEARAAAAVVRGAEALQEVRDDLGDCRRCGLCTGRKHIVFGVGDPEADLVVVGEAPGFQEDRSGEPFVGPAGEMLDKMLENVLGLRREQIYIANVIKCRPPDNRNPLPDEVASCLPFLKRQIAAIRPKVILVLGTVALKSLLGSDQGIMRSRGIWTQYEGTPVMPTFHPAYLLRNAADKRKTWHDLIEVRARYDALGGKR